jgi:uncharacterized protein YdhG (YjbR/CyaY superfamily)
VLKTPKSDKENYMSPKKEIKKSMKRTASGNAYKGLSKEEIVAMKETLKERKANANKEEAEKAVLEKIAEMKGSDHAIAKRIHEIVKTNAPSLSPKTWYGMPAYANADGKIVCFFQSAAKFNSKYATLGFNHDNANLDEGNMWPSAFSIKELTPVEEAKITALVKKAVG